eukprot:3142120-Prorocentrum_lima.AAC.1
MPGRTNAALHGMAWVGVELWGWCGWRRGGRSGNGVGSGCGQMKVGCAVLLNEHVRVTAHDGTGRAAS